MGGCTFGVIDTSVLKTDLKIDDWMRFNIPGDVKTAKSIIVPYREHYLNFTSFTPFEILPGYSIFENYSWVTGT